MKIHTILQIACLLLFGLFSALGFSWSSKEYIERFRLYQRWNKELPKQNQPDFEAFIRLQKPLSKRLREKWLYQLGKNKDWNTYQHSYQPSADSNLQCFSILSNYHTGQKQQAWEKLQVLWPTASPFPSVCKEVISLFFQNGLLQEDWLLPRIRFYLQKNDSISVCYLLTQYKSSQAAELFSNIEIDPHKITTLPKGELQSAFYLYGLQKLLLTAPQKAIALWKKGVARNLLSYSDSQAFLDRLVLYKIKHQHKDIAIWFSRINKNYYSEPLLDWKIRWAIRHKKWATVEAFIGYSTHKKSPIWQYWQARALDARGKTTLANKLYEHLSVRRNYYGFLASLRLKKPFAFEEEPLLPLLHPPKAYTCILEELQSLYQQHQLRSASSLLRDFMSELPKQEKITLLFWIQQHLLWYDKVVYTSSTKELLHQLALRFPLPYFSTMHKIANHYHLPIAYLYAIIRQESAFQKDSVSRKNARGWMQLIPETAQEIAKKEHLDYQNPQQLFLIPLNIQLGAAYLSHLQKRFLAHPIFVAAAYNAGPRNAKRWLQEHPPTDIDRWIETLPWIETRNYIKNVFVFYAIYEYRMHHIPNMEIWIGEKKPLLHA